MENDRLSSHVYKRIACCGCGHTFDVPLSCGNRFCEVCNQPRRRRIQTKLNHFIKNAVVPPGYRWRFVTLTLPRSDDLTVAVRCLVSSFRKLRARSFWRRRVNGGAYVIEVIGRPGNWHAHLHVLVLSSWIPVHGLSRNWSLCSPGKIVHIKSIPPSAMVAYVTKYVTKTDLHPDYQVQASQALKGQRLFQPFGSLHLLTASVPRVQYECPMCGYDSFLPIDARSMEWLKKRAVSVDGFT